MDKNIAEPSSAQPSQKAGDISAPAPSGAAGGAAMAGPSDAGVAPAASGAALNADNPFAAAEAEPVFEPELERCLLAIEADVALARLNHKLDDITAKLDAIARQIAG